VLAIPRSEVGMVITVHPDRFMFPLQATLFRRRLPRVIGPTVSEYYAAIRLPQHLQQPFFV